MSTELLTVAALVLALLALILALYAAYSAYQSEQNAGRCAAWMSQSNASDAGLRRIAEIEAQLTELLDSYDALLASHKKLRARIGMRRNREKGGGAPEAELSSIDDKTKLRIAARSQGLLRG